jgi:hypothetical protein
VVRALYEAVEACGLESRVFFFGERPATQDREMEKMPPSWEYGQYCLRLHSSTPAHLTWQLRWQG